MLTRFYLSNVSAIGALILILSLAISVFTQQAISSVSCEITLPPGSVSLPLGGPIAELPNFMYAASAFDIGPSSKINIIGGLSNPSANRSVSVQGCTTGNCTFSATNGITHSFGGICSKCADTSPGIFLWSNSTNLTDPYTAVFINATGGRPALAISQIVNATGNQSATTTFVPDDCLQSIAGDLLLEGPMDIPLEVGFEVILPSALLNVSVHSLTYAGCTPNATAANCSPSYASVSEGLDPQQFNKWDVLSTSCVLYPCIRNSYAEVVDGIFTETTVSEVVMQPSDSTTQDKMELTFVGVNEPCVIDGALFTAFNYTAIPSWTQNQSVINGQRVPTSCVYGLDQYTGWGLSTYLANILNANCLSGSGNEIEDQWAFCSTQAAATSSTPDAVWFQ